MQKKDNLSKTLTIGGTILVWLPILAPFILGLIVLVVDGNFLFDYLMPGELFMVVFAGSAFLIWAAIRTRSRQKIIFWGSGIAAVSLVTLMLVGGVQPGTSEYVVVMTLLILYWLAIMLVGVGGFLLFKDLFKK
jgi:hypothetical protein